MAFQKGHKTPGPGRPKGSLSKHTLVAKDAIAAAAEGLGGHERMIAWAQEDPLNERAFWSSIYPKLLPLQLTGANGGPIEVLGMTKEQRDASVMAASRADDV
jgi:hypothetical protein